MTAINDRGTRCLNLNCTESVGEDFDAETVFDGKRYVGRVHARCLDAIDAPDFPLPWDAERHIDTDAEAGLPAHLRTPAEQIDSPEADAA